MNVALSSLAGIPTQRRLARWAQLLPRIAAMEPDLMQLTEQHIRKQSLSLRYRARSGEPLDRLLPEAYALVREAARRTLDMRHYDVQLLGGIAMHHRCVAQMQTGEGKTLAATLPMYLASLTGKSALLATVNDYLASRDAKWMGPVYRLLGLSVGIIQSQMPRPQRRQAYRCDVTYGTSKEFGFDFLRDRLLLRQIEQGSTDLLAGMLGQLDDDSGDSPVERDPHFALIDEADSILIDEARTPLIIGSLADDNRKTAEAMFLWAAPVTSHFSEDVQYDYDYEKRLVTLDAVGRRLVRELPKPEELDGVSMYEIYQHVERAIKVERDFVLDRHYVLRKGEVVIVDELTGRLAEGRRWRAGIHQAIEARERVPITLETGQAARVTVQDYFLRFERLAGMTGTATSSARELSKIYHLRVVPVPTNRPAIRQQLPDCVSRNSQEKWRAIVGQVREVHATGRPVLIGTRSIDKSELLAQLLSQAGIGHQVLNARHIAAEAEIVALAGQRGKVTVSTNMAGRGTDIQLGQGVAELGGLHVICTEIHDSARIDRQLIGRCGRQGDPGTYRQHLALDDDILLAGLGPEKARRLQQQHSETNGSLDQFAPLFRKAQANVERKHFRDRRLLMYHEKERKKMQLQMGQDPYLDTPG